MFTGCLGCWGYEEEEEAVAYPQDAHSVVGDRHRGLEHRGGNVTSVGRRGWESEKS